MVQKKTASLAGVLDLGIFGAIVLLGQFLLHGQMRINVIGILTAGLTIIMYSSPFGVVVITIITFQKIILLILLIIINNVGLSMFYLKYGRTLKKLTLREISSISWVKEISNFDIFEREIRPQGFIVHNLTYFCQRMFPNIFRKLIKNNFNEKTKYLYQSYDDVGESTKIYIKQPREARHFP